MFNYDSHWPSTGFVLDYVSNMSQICLRLVVTDNGFVLDMS